MPTTGAISPADFTAIKQRFADLGDRLSDEQLLELADAYHEMLRWRRQLRCRHSAIARSRSVVVAEDISFIDCGR